MENFDIQKVLKSNAHSRASLLIYHYTILEAKGTNVLEEESLNLLISSFTSQKDAKIYNEYKELNIHFNHKVNVLYYKGAIFERDVYKYYYENNVSLFKSEIDKKNIIIHIQELFQDYLNFYTALNQFAKNSNFTNKYYLNNIKDDMKHIQTLYDEFLQKTELKKIKIEPNINEVDNYLNDLKL